MMLRLFSKRARKPKRKYGDFRVVRQETRDGKVTFKVECYFHLDYPFARAEWQNPFITSYPWFKAAWARFDTAEAAQAAIDAHVAENRAEEVVSRSVVSPTLVGAEKSA